MAKEIDNYHVACNRRMTSYDCWRSENQGTVCRIAVTWYLRYLAHALTIYLTFFETFETMISVMIQSTVQS